tara:strand:- start:498 stop:1199 length:702 start_codon:yes stop_codon:yes gene_type:complete
MKVLCIIPARKGSKGIKNKNIIKIKKKILFYYSIEFAQKLKFINKIIFSSDSKEYIKKAKKFKNIHLSLRPKKYSKDHSLMVDYVKYQLKDEKENGNIYDLVLLLQVTCPFRNHSNFEKAYKVLKSKKFDSVITINKAKDHPNRLKKYKKGNLVNYLQKLKTEDLKPRQKLSQIFARSGSMYFFRTSLPIKKNTLVGTKTYGIKVSGKYAINIDDYNDLVLAKHFANRRKKLN